MVDLHEAHHSAAVSNNTQHTTLHKLDNACAVFGHDLDLLTHFPQSYSTVDNTFKSIQKMHFVKFLSLP